MARVIENQLNLWGKQQGVEAQRSDLWVVDFAEALKGLGTNVLTLGTMTSGLSKPYVPPKLATYFAQSVVLPELKVRPEQYRRDSRPYNMPSWDEPVDAVTMTFILDCYRPGGANVSPYRSDIYQMLDIWRACVRAGRGPMSSEYSVRLNADYRVDYAFDVRVRLLRAAEPIVSGVGAAVQTGIQAASVLGLRNLAAVGQLAVPSLAAFSIINDLQFSMELKLMNCWLGSFKMADLNYEAAKVVLLTATFYAEDVRQEPQNAS